MTGIPDAGGRRRGALRRVQLGTLLVALSLLGTACGSRLTDGALNLAEGVGHGGTASGSGSCSGTTGPAAATNGVSNIGYSGGTGTLTGNTSGAVGGGPSTASGGGLRPASASCTASNNGGATDVGVTANQILLANITSITGVAPGLTKSAQQATQAVADYINSQGGICGRFLKVQAFDDGNTSSGNYADAEQACSSDFAMLGNASGFDDGAASAVSKCGVPDVAAEVSTHEAGNVPQIFGATPGNSHYWPTGAAVWLKRTHPNAINHAAMIYLQVPATQEQAQAEMATYSSVWGIPQYAYVKGVSPTEPNYAPYVQDMESAGIQYVTEYSDDNSAARLSQAMQQASFTPQVVDWFSEMYTPAFLSETQGTANGDLVLMATSPYEEASDPGMQLFLSWMNRVAPGFTHDIFAEFAWSAGLLFYQAAEAVGPHLTRAALLGQLAQIHKLPALDTVQAPEDFGSKIPSNCFSYFKINNSGSGYTRVYPSSGNDCTSGTLTHY